MASITKWRPGKRLAPRSLFESALDDIFEDMEELMEKTGRRKGWPKIEAFQKNGNYVVKADVPGMEAKDIEVTLENDLLIIKGERKEDQEINKKNLKGREIFYGSFQRALPVPPGLKAEDIKARYHNGVLEITARLHKALPARQIKVDAEKSKEKEA